MSILRKLMVLTITLLFVIIANAQSVTNKTEPDVIRKLSGKSFSLGKQQKVLTGDLSFSKIKSNLKSTFSTLFFEDFASGTMPATFTLVDGDGNTPAYSWATEAWVVRTGTQFAASISYYNPAGTSNDWMITPAITIGPAATLSWLGVAPDPDWRDGYKVMITNVSADTVEFQDTLLYVDAEVGGFWTEHSVSIPPKFANSNIYIAFVNTSTDKNILYIDSIIVEEPTGDDAAITKFLGPTTSGCLGSTSETVRVRIANLGANAITGFDVTYVITPYGGAPGTPVTETINQVIDPGAILDYSFATIADLSAPEYYGFQVYTSLINDINPTNDTINKYIFSSVPLNPSDSAIVMGFEGNEEFYSWRFAEDANADNQTWTVNEDTSGALAHTGTMYSKISAHTITNNDDWFFTQCLDLEASKTYQLKFWELVVGSQNRLIDVKIGNAQSSSAMTQTIETYDLFDTIYTERTKSFSVPSNGTYYIGFHDRSDPNPSFPDFCIDDISLTVGGAPTPPVANYTFLQTGPKTVSFTETSTGGPFINHSWNYGDGSNPDTAYNPVHIFPDTLTYWVCLTVTKDTMTSTKCDSVKVSGLVNINELIGNNFISVFPNPVKHKFTVNFSGLKSEKTELVIYNIIGERIMITKNINNNSSADFDLSNFPQGMYMIEIKTDNAVYTKKFVITE